MALGFLGERPIYSLTDTDTTSVVMNRFFPSSRQSALRRFLWNFAMNRTTINRNPVAPPFDYTDAYQLPNDFIRFQSINGWNIPLGSTTPIGPFASQFYQVVNNAQLYCNANGSPSLQVRYIQDVIDPSLWDACALRVWAYQLALDVALTITQNPIKVKTMQAGLDREIPEAVSITVQENKLRRVQVSKAIQARRAYGSYGTSNGWQYFDNGSGAGDVWPWW